MSSIRYQDIDDLENQLKELLVPLFEAITDSAASYAATMYDDIRDHEIGRSLPATPYSAFTPDGLNGYIDSLLGAYIEGQLEHLISQLQRRATYEIKKASGESVVYNSAHDPYKPKYARVPTGPETCEWCIMLASRGYVYASAKSAGALTHWHENCDCVIVPQFDEKYQVKGYDPKYYEGIWNDNVVYDEYGHVDTKATLKNIREWTGRDEGYYEDHKEQRHAYYEYVKENGLIGGGESKSRGRNRDSKYAHEGSGDVPTFKDFNDVKEYLYGAESVSELNDRHKKLVEIYGPGSEQVLSQALDNVVKTALNRLK